MRYVGLLQNAPPPNTTPEGNRPDAAYEGSEWSSLTYSVFYESGNGSRVYVPEGWQESNESEQVIACHLADGGKDVVLRIKSETTAQLTSDAFVLNLDQWEEWEFKSVAGIPTVNSIRRHIKDGRKQGATVLIYIGNVSINAVDMEDVNEGVATALRRDEARLLQKIVLMSRLGTTQTKTRKELDNGEGFTKF